MPREEIKAKLKDIFSSVRTKKIDIEINEDSELAEDLYLDSLEQVEMLFEIENKFSISISDDEAREFKKVKDIIDIIQVKTSSQERAN